MTKFRMGSLDHVHLVVPDRAEAARRYAEQLGFDPVPDYAAWAKVEGGPILLSADGGRSGLALFQLGSGHAATTLEMGAAFRVGAGQFVRFARRLATGFVRDLDRAPLTKEAVADFGLCYAYNFLDPWGNRFELNCYDTEGVKRELVDPDGITPIRHW